MWLLYVGVALFLAAGALSLVIARRKNVDIISK